MEVELDRECSAEHEVGGHVWLGESDLEGAPKAEQHQAGHEERLGPSAP